MYLIDTNVVLEILLGQKNAEEAKQFLQKAAPAQLYMTEFSLYSLGIILVHRKMYEAFLRTVDDLFVKGGMPLLRLGVEDMHQVAAVARKFRLDFDDAYQYVAAQRYGLTVVSFDSDFDRTEHGRKAPAEAAGGRAAGKR